MNTTLPPDLRVPLLEVVELLHHPNFYWGAMNGLTNLKYLTLQIDTRDNRCLVTDRDGNPVKLADIRAGLANPTMLDMNENPGITIVPDLRETEGCSPS